MVEGPLIEMLMLARLDTFLVGNVDRLAKSNCFMDVLAWKGVESTLSITPVAALAKKYFIEW